MRTLSTILCSLIMLAASATDEVTWLSKVHDFGAFDEDTKSKTAVFKFVNTTADSVVVISATATCGCTTPIYDQAPIAPGDTGTIKVSYDPSGRPGRFNKQVYVRTSDSYDRTKLVLQGTVIGNPETINGRYPISMGPMKLRSGAAMLGKAKAGHTKMHYIDGYNMSADSIAPKIVASPDWLTTTASPQKVAPGEMMSLDITFDGSKCDQWGIITDSIMISPTPTADAYALPVIVIVEEDFSMLTPQQRHDAPTAKLSSDRIDLGNISVKSNSVITGSAALTNDGIDPLIVRRVFSQDPGINVSISSDTLKKGESADIKVTYDPSVQPTGIINARVTVITNDPFNPSQILRVVGDQD